MRISTTAAAILLASAGAALAANDGPWCYRDFSGPQYGNCSFYSARECLAVAGLMGGICERNHRPAEKPAPPPRAHGRSWRK